MVDGLSAFWEKNGMTKESIDILTICASNCCIDRCQPWTITLTGMLAITGSWLILHSMLVTTIISLLICSWWYIFLYSYPKAYTDMIAERRKRVRSGIEDIFGSTKADGIDQTSN
ncbi:hypothetical protein ACJRO7_013037 [Eucalyptus globulus]